MWTLVLAGASALLIAGSSAVFAQQQPDSPDRGRWELSQEDIAAFAAARIAALRAGLVLTPEQEKNWPSVEAALKDLARFRLERRAARLSGRPVEDPTERLRRRAGALAGLSTILMKLADAQEPLYRSLDEAQKRRFDRLTRWMRGGWRHRHPRGSMGPGGMGPGRMGPGGMGRL